MEGYLEGNHMHSDEELDQRAIQDSCRFVLGYLDNQMLIARKNSDSQRINDVQDMIDAIMDLHDGASFTEVEDELSLDF